MVSRVNYRPEYLVSNNGSITIQYLSSGYTNIQTAGGGGVPASPTTSVQFNDAGAFGGSANFTYVTGTNTLTVGNLVSANFTSAAQGLVPASGGGTVNFLRADGTFAAPPAATPASPVNSVQFNDAGAFGGSANFTYVTGTNTLTVGPAGSTTIIETLAPTGATVAGTLQIRGKNASATNGIGGGITLITGNGTGTSRGGNFVLTAGTGVSTTGIGGSITMTSGSGRVGGALNLVSGTGNVTNGGAFTLSSGAGTSQGGAYLLSAGSGGATGGTISIISGSTFSGASGDVTISAGQGNSANGLMSLQQGAVLIKYSGGGDDPYSYEIGFYGNAPINKPVITGSRATGAALQNLLTKLASLGLITDSTTA